MDEPYQSAFERWNTALLDSFFSPAHQDEAVVLAVGTDELDQLAPDLGGYEGLCAAVRVGPSWFPWNRKFLPGCSSPFEEWAQELINLRKFPRLQPVDFVDPTELLAYGEKSDSFPTYLPILAVLVAAYSKGEKGKGGFYNEARKVLGLQPTSKWGSVQLELVNALWRDLGLWTDETEGRFGIFNPAVLGKHKHVGVLRSQSVFRISDFERLPRVFAGSGFSPDEKLSSEQVRGMVSQLRTERGLSLGLQEAAKSLTYQGFLEERIRTIFGDWDGQVPELSSTTESEGRSPASVGVGLALHLTDGDLPWRVGLRVNAIGDVGGLRLSFNGYSWLAGLGGFQDSIAQPVDQALEPGSGHEQLLEEAMQADGRTLKIDVEGANNLSQTLKFRHKDLRYFVNDLGKGCFVERDALPGFGPAYFLCSPSEAGNTFSTLPKRSEVELTDVRAQGLPEGWKLWFVEECSTLADVIMPDGLGHHSRARIVSLVGGVRINRGGRTLFLPYDLPLIEVDAPNGTQVKAHGLTLVPEGSAVPDTPGFKGTTIRRFRVEPNISGQRSFRIEACSKEGETLGTATLRLASGDSSATLGDARLGLNPSGGSTREEPFLLGMDLCGHDWKESPPPEGTRKLEASELGEKLSPARLQNYFPTIPEVLFLDSLACADCMALSYGRARDRIHNYMNQVGRRDRFDVLLPALRRRGFVEVVTNLRGRWEAVAKVPPALFRLPLVVDGHRVWGVSGTLSIKHWSSLTQLGVELRGEFPPTLGIPIVRLLGGFDLRQAQQLGFQTIDLPSTAIGQFSSSLEDYRAYLSEAGTECLDAGNSELSFNPMTANWGETKGEWEWDLLHYMDSETGVHRLHSVRYPFEGASRFRHVRDERLGTWLAYSSCIEWIEEKFGQEGLAPWPLSYNFQTGEFWLPARMNFPYVLERALAAASGGPPNELMLHGEPGAEGNIFGRTSGGVLRGPFPSIYEQFLPPAGENRTWLQYRWVPEELAKIIAGKLDCRLDDPSKHQPDNKS